MSKREIFSWCGQLTGHLPVANWLRPAYSFLKRNVSDGNWDEKVSDASMIIVKDIYKRFMEKDPSQGVWNVPRTNNGILSCDASV